VAVTDLVNLLLEGKAPLPVRRALFGATVLAIAKKQGGIRPIAVRYVWRRLAAKVACTHVKVASAFLLTPIQLGFGVLGERKQQFVQRGVISTKYGGDSCCSRLRKRLPSIFQSCYRTPRQPRTVYSTCSLESSSCCQKKAHNKGSTRAALLQGATGVPSVSAGSRLPGRCSSGIHIDDDRWTQASLPVRWGGLGVRSAALLASSAYLASAASSLPVYFRSACVMLWTAESLLLYFCLVTTGKVVAEPYSCMLYPYRSQ